MRYRSCENVPPEASPEETATVSTDMSRPSPHQTTNAELVLRRASVAYLALVENGSGGVPYVVPINFAYDGGAPATSGPAAALGAADRPTARLFFHSGAGRKTRALAENPRVCLAVTADVSFVAGPSPCEEGFAYKSVLVWGRAVRLESREEREQALRLIVAKYDPKAADQAFDEHDFEQTLVYAVTIDDLSFKQRPRSRPE
jgi:nitroimidazol reductase NimA-like FMN-containing flavoprotein (pyridoxamine 5'-phosphate oxidase superfamily)